MLPGFRNEVPTIRDFLARIYYIHEVSKHSVPKAIRSAINELICIRSPRNMRAKQSIIQTANRLVKRYRTISKHKSKITAHFLQERQKFIDEISGEFQLELSVEKLENPVHASAESTPHCSQGDSSYNPSPRTPGERN